MSKALEITKEVWGGMVSVSKVVCSVCAVPLLLITFLNNCGVHLDSYNDPTKHSSI